jgi:hypothetical protein
MEDGRAGVTAFSAVRYRAAHQIVEGGRMFTTGHDADQSSKPTPPRRGSPAAPPTPTAVTPPK